MYTIYCRTNSITGLKYVGLTSRSIEERWQEFVNSCEMFRKKKRHPLSKKSDKNAMRRDFLEHDVSVWSHDVLETSDSLFDALIAERNWIAKLHTQDPNVGYNKTPGGDVLINHNLLMSLETLRDEIDRIRNKI